MPQLTIQQMVSREPTPLTFTALDGTTDSFLYNGATDDLLVFENTSSGDVTVTLSGDEASTINVSGVTELDVSGGKSVVLTANSFVKVSLRNCAAYLSDSTNEPTITGGTADILVAHIGV